MIKKPFILGLHDDCFSPLGINSKAIPDSDITHSSAEITKEGFTARLNTVGGWNPLPLALDKEPCIQIFLKNKKMIKGVTTQGTVNRYLLAYRQDGAAWQNYTEKGRLKVSLH